MTEENKEIDHDRIAQLVRGGFKEKSKETTPNKLNLNAGEAGTQEVSAKFRKGVVTRGLLGMIRQNLPKSVTLLEYYNVLGGMVSLGDFTLANLVQFSQVNSNSVWEVIKSKLELLSLHGKEGRGEFLLPDDHKDEIREELKLIWKLLLDDSGFEVPLGILCAQDNLRWRWSEAQTDEDKKQVIDLTRIDLAGGIADLESMFIQLGAESNKDFRDGMTCPHCECGIKAEDIQSARTDKQLKADFKKEYQPLIDKAKKQTTFLGVITLVLFCVAYGALFFTGNVWFGLLLLPAFFVLILMTRSENYEQKLFRQYKSQYPF